MTHRRKFALLAGALVLTAPVLSSCGFNYKTDKINTTTNAVTNRDKSVDVIGAVIIAGQPNSGTLSARLVNNSDKNTVELRSVTGSGDTVLTTGELAPIELGPREGVTLIDEEEGIRIDGQFAAGNFVSLSIGFSNGDEVVLDVPVVKACDFYEGLDSAPALGTAPGAEPAEESAPYSCDEPEEAQE